MEVITEDFPTCWEMQVMDNSNAKGGEDKNGDVYAWYIDGSSSDHATQVCLTSFSLLWQHLAAML